MMGDLWVTGSSDLSHLANSKTTKTAIIDGLRAKTLFRDDMHTLTKHHLLAHAIFDCIRGQGVPNADDEQLKSLAEMTKATNDELKRSLRDSGIPYQEKDTKAELWRLLAVREVARGYVAMPLHTPYTKTLAQEGISSVASPSSTSMSGIPYQHDAFQAATTSNADWPRPASESRTSMVIPEPIPLQRHLDDLSARTRPMRSRASTFEPNLPRHPRPPPISSPTNSHGSTSRNNPFLSGSPRIVEDVPGSANKPDTERPSRRKEASVDTNVIRDQIKSVCNKVSSAQDPAQSIIKWLDSYLPEQLANLARPKYDNVFVQHIKDTLKYKHERHYLEDKKEALQTEIKDFCSKIATLSKMVTVKTEEMQYLDAKLNNMSLAWEDKSLSTVYGQIRRDISEESNKEVDKLMRPSA